MSELTFYDSVETARRALDAEKPDLAFIDSLRGVDLSDADATLAFLQPQLHRVEQAIYMTKYPEANYAEFMPVDTQGDVWTPGSIHFSGDITGKPEWFDVAADDMPYAEFSRTQFLQENHIRAIGLRWTRADLEKGQRLGVDMVSGKVDAANKSAERDIHKIATVGDGVKFTTGFFNNPLVTSVAAGATLAASTPDEAVTIVNAALTSVEVNTGETMQADTLALPTGVYNGLVSRRMTDTNMTVLRYIQENSVVPNLTIKKTRHLTTSMIAYANTPEAHRFHLPGGGLQLGPDWQVGHYVWARPGIYATGGYECRLPKAFTKYTGVAA
ncbi:MAG: putative major capsid protein [Prokaryotic dsDNA virus sp.]|jgi:hypothetical protein|nr:MAG: putative major capsid protein [Prokaryotic dsDNA virus sp.]|tara:strand:+ start:37122 stop:38105 length:984 start_codon:yes stop_codon:yes gene_type:complete